MVVERKDLPKFPSVHDNEAHAIHQGESFVAKALGYLPGLAFLGAGTTPLLARHTMQALEGNAPSKDLSATLKRDLAPIADHDNTAQTKLHLANVLAGRALAQLAA